MKKIVGILVCMLMLVPVFSITVAAEYNGPDIYWKSVKGGKGITAVIKNYGNEIIYDIDYFIWTPGEFIVRGEDTRGTIESLAPGEEITVQAEPYGFGRLNIFRTKGFCYLYMHLEGAGGMTPHGSFFLIIGDIVFMLPKTPAKTIYGADD